MAEIAEQWITTAQRLREVRKARDEFLVRGALEVASKRSGGSSDRLSDVDRLSAEVAREVLAANKASSRMLHLFDGDDFDD